MWGAIASIGGSLLGMNSANKAAKAQRKSEQEALAFQREMYDQQRKDFQPYMQAGQQAIGGLQNLTSADGRAQMLNDYYNSDEFGAMQSAANTNTARNAAVTGGLRSGSNYLALEGIAPQLGQSYLNNMYNQQTGLANLGMGAASQGANAAFNYGNQAASAQRNMGEIYAQNQMAQGQAIGSIFNELGGVAGGLNLFGLGG